MNTPTPITAPMKSMLPCRSPHTPSSIATATSWEIGPLPALDLWGEAGKVFSVSGGVRSLFVECHN